MSFSAIIRTSPCAMCHFPCPITKPCTVIKTGCESDECTARFLLQDPNEPCYCHHATMQRARKHQLINDEIKIIYYHLKLPMTIWNCAKVTQLTLLIKSLVLFLVWLDSTNKFILIHKNFSDRMHFPTIKVAINQLLY